MKELDTVLEHLNAAVGVLKTLTTQARQAIAGAELLANKARQEFDQLDALRVSLEERDAEISLKEQAVLSAEDVAKEKDKVSALRADLDNERTLFARVKAEAESVIAQREADVSAQSKDLARREAELKKEKETYKENLLADIKKNMGLK
jgi:hypothetical protein